MAKRPLPASRGRRTASLTEWLALQSMDESSPRTTAVISRRVKRVQLFRCGHLGRMRKAAGFASCQRCQSEGDHLHGKNLENRLNACWRLRQSEWYELAIVSQEFCSASPVPNILPEL